jgi:hypothetical protein
MKKHFLHKSRWLVVMLLVIMGASGVMAQGPGGLTSDATTQEVCVGTEPYAVIPGNVANIFLWEITPGVAGTDWIITTPNAVSTDVQWLVDGIYTLTLTETDGELCSTTQQVIVTVNALPLVEFVGTYGPYCVDGAVVTLVATPAGGTFTGNGITGDQFDPAIAGIGIHTITYTFSDGNGCENSATIDIVVNSLPVITIDPIGPFCSNDDVITLTATPVGGTFNGLGITGNQFDPTVAGPGSHVITYTYDDGNCIGTGSITIEVNPAPTTSPIWHD